jgi:phage-related protein
MNRREEPGSGKIPGEESHPVSKPLFILRGEIKTPPMGTKARQAVGFLLREVQDGNLLSMPDSRPMPQIAADCHELRIEDHDFNTKWRVLYFIDETAIVVLDVFAKKTGETPELVKKVCRERRSRYLNAKEGK